MGSTLHLGEALIFVESRFQQLMQTHLRLYLQLLPVLVQFDVGSAGNSASEMRAVELVENLRKPHGFPREMITD